MGVPMLSEYEAYVLTKERQSGRAPASHGRRGVAATDLGLILVFLAVLLTAGSFARWQRAHSVTAWEAWHVAASPANAEGEASHD